MLPSTEKTQNETQQIARQLLSTTRSEFKGQQKVIHPQQCLQMQSLLVCTSSSET